jgi:CheY-like chemotaxis protein
MNSRNVVLIVDDSVERRGAYSTLVEECGYQALEATHSEASRSIRTLQPDLVLFDITVSSAYGAAPMETPDFLTQYGIRGRVPSLGLTPCDPSVEIERTRGFLVEVLVKPCEPNEIKSRINQLMTVAGLWDQ